MSRGLIDRTLSELVSRTDIKQGTVSGRTDGNGNIHVPITAKIILFAWDGIYIYIPFFWSGGWYLRVQQTNAGGTAMTNINVTANVYYYE